MADRTSESSTSRWPEVRQGVRYASGNFGKSLQESTFSFLYLYYLVSILKVDAAVAGTILFLSMLVDAACNPIVGHVIDRWLRKRRTYQALILSSVPLSTLFFILLFALPALVPHATAIVALIATILFRLGATLVDVPHNALLADLTGDGRERVRLSSWRFFFSTAGNFAVSFGLIPVLMSGKTASSAGIMTFIVASAALYAGVMCYCASGRSAAAARPPVAPFPNVRIAAAVADIGRNVRLIQILCVFVLAAGFATIFSRMTLFYAASWLGDAALAPYLVMAQMIGQVTGLPLWQRLASRMEKRSTAVCANLLFGAAMLLFVLFPSRLLSVAMIFYCLAGIGLSGLTVMNWAIIPDAIDYTEAASGRRHEAFTFGVLLLLNKLASGFSLAFVGWSLALAGFGNGAVPSHAAAVPLVLLMAIPPLAGAIASALVLANLRISYGEHRGLARAC